MLSAFMFNQTSMQETSSTERVILRKSGEGGGTIGGGSVESQEREATRKGKAHIKKPNKRNIKAPP